MHNTPKPYTYTVNMEACDLSPNTCMLLVNTNFLWFLYMDFI